MNTTSDIYSDETTWTRINPPRAILWSFLVMLRLRPWTPASFFRMVVDSVWN